MAYLWGFDDATSLMMPGATPKLNLISFETFINIEAKRRFGEDWFAELRMRAFSGAEQCDTTYWLRKNDYVKLSVSKYF